MKYDQLEDGDVVKPVMRNFRLACCDCGLVHRLDFKIKGRHVEFRTRRDRRATAAMRRKLK